MDQLREFAAALAGLAMVGIIHPSAAVAVGAFAGGYTIGASKNKSALAELGRGLIVGVAFGAATWLFQSMIAGRA